MFPSSGLTGLGNYLIQISMMSQFSLKAQESSFTEILGNIFLKLPLL